MTENSREPHRPQSIPARRNLTLFLLLVVYTFNFIDRQIVGILAIPIKADLGLSDSQLGLMGGLAFALFYTGLGIPIAMLADRFSRTWIMTIALTLWSAMTAVCGLAGLIALAASCSSMMGYGLFFWLPSFFVRSFGLSLLDASLIFGAILLIGGVAGIWGGGWMADRFGPDNPRRYLTIPAWAWLAIPPLNVLGVLTPNLTLCFFVLLVPAALGLVWLGPVVTTIQHMVRPDMRATASAVFLFINNLLGIGLGTWALGALSDGLTERFAEHALRYSIVAGSSFYLLACALMFIASRRVERDLEVG